MTVFGDWAFGEVSKVKRGHKSRALISRTPNLIVHAYKCVSAHTRPREDTGRRHTLASQEKRPHQNPTLTAT